METATFGAGCFWGVQHMFDMVKGVTETTVGYMGGDEPNPDDNLIYSHKSKHVEVVEMTFDPTQVSYEQLVRYFFTIHDPTQMNRQGPDVGWQYRSVIFYHSDTQREVAERVKMETQDMSQYTHREITTAIEPASKFWRAAEHHQKFTQKHGGAACHI